MGKYSLHLFVFSDFFHHCFEFFSVRIFHPLVKFFPKYFIVFNAIMNRILFIYFSDISLLVYKNETDFFMLTLYAEHLLNLLIVYTDLLVDYLGLSLLPMSSELMTILFIFYGLVVFYFFILQLL